MAARDRKKRQADPQPRATRTLTRPLPDWIWPVLIVAALAVVFFPLLFQGKVFSSPDAQAPQGFAVYSEQWRQEHGEYPLWNPFIFCGMQSFGSLAYNPGLYPGDWPLRLLGSLAPGMLWMILYYMIGAVALYAFLRDRGALPGPAALAGLAFVLTPNLIAVGAHGHGSQLVCSGWMPVALFALNRFYQRGSWIWVSALAAAVGLQLLRGHVQIAYYTWLVLGVYAIYYLIDVGRAGSTFRVPRARGIAGTVVGLGLGLALAAALVVPVLAYTPLSIRGGGPDGGVSLAYATQWSMSVAELWTALVPSALGFGGRTYWGTMPFTDYPNAYVGILTLAFAGLGFVLARGRVRDGVVLGFLVVFSLIVALGNNAFLYPLLYDALPMFKKFRIPVMILVVMHLALTALMAHGLTRLSRALEQESTRATILRWSRVKAIGGLALVLLVLLGGQGFESWYAERMADSPRMQSYVSAGNATPADIAALAAPAAGRTRSDLIKNVLLVSLAAAAVMLLAQRRLPWPAFVAVVAGLMAVDLVPVAREVMNPLIQPETVLTRVTEPDDVTTFLAERDPHTFRIMPIEEFGANRFATFGISSIGGYHAAKPKYYQEFMEATGIDTRRVLGSEAGFRILDFLGVRYIVTRFQMPEHPRFRVVHEGSFRIYENQQALPRAIVTGVAEVLASGAPTLTRLAAPDFDPRRAVIVTESPGPLGGATTRGRASITELGLNHVTLAAESDGAALVVVAEGYDPGWSARVDGEPVPVLRANHAFRAVRIEAGTHTIEMRYRDSGLRIGIIVSIVAGALIVGIAGLEWGRSRRRAATVSS